MQKIEPSLPWRTIDKLPLRTIDKLPDSGVPVLIFMQHVNGDREFRIAMYALDGELKADSDMILSQSDVLIVNFDDETDTWYCNEGLYEKADGSNCDYEWYLMDDSECITHWLPLNKPII